MNKNGKRGRSGKRGETENANKAAVRAASDAAAQFSAMSAAAMSSAAMSMAAWTIYGAKTTADSVLGSDSAGGLPAEEKPKKKPRGRPKKRLK